MADPYADPKISATIDKSWDRVINRIVGKGRREGRESRAQIVRNGLRLYLQHVVVDPEEWSELDLGPIPDQPTYPDHAIDATAEEIEVDPNAEVNRVRVPGT